MPAHRSLSLKTFIKALNNSDITLLQRYFQRIMAEEQIPPHLSVMYYEYVNYLLETLDNEQAREMILEDFRRINDICEKKASTLVWTGKLFKIEISPNEPLQGLAMRLFLDYPEAFEYAWTRYCVYASPSKVSRHNLPCRNLQIDAEKLQTFEKEMQKYFVDSAKGEECHVHYYDESEQVILLVERGSYFRALVHWENKEVKIKSIRPAVEDILTYERKNGQLCIQTSYPAEMEQYIRSFAGVFIGDPLLVGSPDRDRVYALDHIFTNSFSWAGNEFIKRIVLVGARFKINGATEAVMDIHSRDLRVTLEQDLGRPDLSMMEIMGAKFSMIIEDRGKEDKVNFEIAPPYATDLPKKKHADIISAYLKENGVQLR